MVKGKWAKVRSADATAIARGYLYYYYNVETLETTWERPAGFIIDENENENENENEKEKENEKENENENEKENEGGGKKAKAKAQTAERGKGLLLQALDGDTGTRTGNECVQVQVQVLVERAPIVVDCGSCLTKAGISLVDDEDGTPLEAPAPSVAFHSMVGTADKYKRAYDYGASRSRPASDRLYIGDEAYAQCAALKIHAPIERGLVTNWEHMESVWRHMFYSELRVSPEEHPIILAEPPLNPKANRERMTMILFEVFGVPKININSQAVFAIIASGRETGLSVDCGHGGTVVAPVYSNFLIPHAMLRIDVGGKDVREYLLKKLLSAHGLSWSCRTSKEKIADAIMETLCYVAMDFDSEKAEGKSYTLPDKSIINVGEERVHSAEILFQPALVGLQQDGIHTAVHRSIAECYADVQEEMYQSVVVSGGLSMFEGFQQRLEKEVVSVAPSGMTVKIIAPPERNFLSWTGAVMLGALAVRDSNHANQYIWMTKDDYEEGGAKVIHRKCPI